MLTTFMLVATSCHKELVQKDPLPKTMSDLDVSATFDWNTSKDYSVSISSTTSLLIKISSADGAVYQKGMILPNETFCFYDYNSSFFNIFFELRPKHKKAN